jgi:arginine repressor
MPEYRYSQAQIARALRELPRNASQAQIARAIRKLKER